MTPLPGGTTTQIQVVVPAGTPTGPGSFQAVNAPYVGNVQSGVKQACPSCHRAWDHLY